MKPSEREPVTELCAAHPEVKAVAVCGRCGDYHCADCNKDVGGRPLCARCRSLPGVDYLEDTRRRFWGKRDALTWCIGVLIPLSALTTTPALVSVGDWLHVASNAVWFAFAISYLALKRIARDALLGLTAANLGFELVLPVLGWQVVVAARHQKTIPSIIFGGLISLVIAKWLYHNPRNKLAFRIPVDDYELLEVYDRYRSNPFALRAAVYGVVALCVPFASAITLFMGVRGLLRADLNAWPPRGGRLPAQIGIAVSVLGLVIWGFVLARNAPYFLH